MVSCSFTAHGVSILMLSSASLSPSASFASTEELEDTFGSKVKISPPVTPFHEHERYSRSLNASTPASHTHSSDWAAVYHIICIVAGTGMLGLPYALKKVGWFGVPLMVFAAFIAYYSGKILIKCLYHEPGQRKTGYADIGNAAFGRIGETIVLFFNGTNLLGSAMIYVIMAGMNLDMLTGHKLGIQAWIFICSSLIYIALLFAKNMKEIALFSLFGVLTSVIVCIIVVVLAFQDLSNNGRPEHAFTEKNPPNSGGGHDGLPDTIKGTGPGVGTVLFNFANIPAALATMSFAFSGNVVYPQIEESMKNRRSWPKMLGIALIICTLMYSIISITAYNVYREKTLSPIFLNLPPGAATTTAIVLLTAHVLLALPILITSFVIPLEKYFSYQGLPRTQISPTVPRSSAPSASSYDSIQDELVVQDLNDPLFSSESTAVEDGVFLAHPGGSVYRELFVRIVIRGLTIAFVAIVSCIVPFFSHFMQLIGAITSSTLVFILPILFHFQLFKQISIVEKVWGWFIICIGCLAGVVGGWEAIVTLWKDFHGSS